MQQSHRLSFRGESRNLGTSNVTPVSGLRFSHFFIDQAVHRLSAWHRLVFLSQKAKVEWDETWTRQGVKSLNLTPCDTICHIPSRFSAMSC